MNTTEFVHDAMPATQRLRVEVAAGPAFETLVGLSALTSDGDLGRCSPALRRALERVGVRSSELWLHLLGLALERPHDLAGAVRQTSAEELRRHLVGVQVPAWRDLVGSEALEATARGDDALLDHPAYYAGEARDSLALLLPLTPAETKLRGLAAGDATLTELAGTAETAKSTAHHHLAHLRAAGLVTMRGNARAYRFALRTDGFAEARRVLAELGTA